MGYAAIGRDFEAEKGNSWASTNFVRAVQFGRSTTPQRFELCAHNKALSIVLSWDQDPILITDVIQNVQTQYDMPYMQEP